ncbi:MAG TPA: hypothetical protein DIT13_06585 [Verrucomicrobiales bacterium]|nr:hypothetical protein [Verrucomicrobiales bacterium]HRJ09226.1 protein translocase subunit SecD [Prosthecobacter sp.]HRK13112.1 protein translocase subunit SecD [Prosthecobacter sp.]
MSPILTFFIGAAILMLLLFYNGTTVHNRRRMLGTVLIVVTSLFAVLSIRNMGIKRGIDLLGGSEFVVQLKPGVDDEGQPKPVASESVQQAIGILQKRLDPEAQTDLLLAPQGEDRILVQMPGVKAEEFDEVRQKIQQVAKLEFRIVHQDSQSKIAEIAANGGVKEPGWDELKYKVEKDAQGKELPSRGSELVRNRPDMEGKYVSSAFATFDAEGWKVYLNLDSTGAKLFDEIAAANKGRQMAIIVDGEIISAPVLQTDHFGGTAVISGNFKEQEARVLASLLENPLENPMDILSESAVSATYGEASIRQGIKAGLAGLALVLVFMVFYYRTAGLIAIAGLAVNLLLLFGAMALFQFTLTMPGIAGIALTIGMAVDANVLIYERLREEMAAGKSLAGALESAFEKAFSAIFDSNITTLITAAILFALASGLVKGFAVTLTIGLLTSMFGALIVTRVLFNWFIDKGILTNLKTATIIPHKVFPILNHAPKFIVASLVITAVSFGALFVKGKHSFGIDFRGGALVHLQLAEGKDLSTEELDAFVKTLKIKDEKSGAESPVGTFYTQKKGSLGEGAMITLRCEFEAGTVIEAGIKGKYPAEVVAGTQVERVGALIGSELAEKSSVALGLAFMFIFIFMAMRFELAFAIGTVVALVHDVMLVPGLCVLLGQEMSVIHVGALLAIAGYSVNDTIIVFDRIREVIKRGGSGGIRDMMNEAISLTLSRTLLTSTTTLFPMIVLLLFGNPAMLEFALPIIIGVFLGTYSSVFIAAPFVLWYARKTGRSLKRQVLEAEEEARKAQAAIAAAKQAQIAGT